jgi:hypothetical protein
MRKGTVMNDSKSLYTKACNLVDMVMERWSQSHGGTFSEKIGSESYGNLVQSVATEIFKMDMYKNNIALVRSLSTDMDDVGMDLTGEVPGDLSDLFDVFDDDDEDQ